MSAVKKVTVTPEMLLENENSELQASPSRGKEKKINNATSPPGIRDSISKVNKKNKKKTIWLNYDRSFNQ